MALKLISGPFEMKDLYGDYREATVHLWCDELDGFLAQSSWHPNPSAVELEWGMGIMQTDGTFTPRRSLPYGTEGIPYYDLGRRKLAMYQGSPAFNFARDVDWHTLQAPYIQETTPLNFAGDGVHEFDSFTRMFLPDRILIWGKLIDPPFYVGNGTTKIFSLAYGATAAPVAEHTIQTELVPGSGVYEDWRPLGSNITKMIQSGTPDRTVFLVWTKGNESRVVEYDYVQHKTIGWVRRLGIQPDLSYELAIGGQVYPRFAGYSVKHKFWLVTDTPSVSPSEFHYRVSIFADEAEPANLSNPVGLTPTRAGEAVRYRVRLTGADGDPCIGHRVNWTSSHLGTVNIPQSLTDDGGYAETLVAYPPLADGPWEGTTITAEVDY